MKFLLVLSLCLGTLTAIAHDHEGGTFEDAKAKTLAHLDERIAHINTTKSCVSAATTKEALKECKKQMHDSGKSMRKEWKAEKKAKK